MADCINCGNGQAVLGYGTTLEIQDPSKGAWVLACGIQNFNGPTSSRGEIDVTTLCSTAKEYVLDLKDFGTVEFSGLLLYGNAGQMLLDELFNSAEKTNYRLTVPDDGYGNGAVELTFEGRVQSQPITVAPGAASTVSFTVRITGDVTITRPTDMGAHIQYTPTVLNESSGNDGAVSGVVSVILRGDTFTGTNGSPITAVTFLGTPDGLTASAQKIGDTTAIISFSGAATSHDDGDTASVVVSFGNAAFTTGPASAISGAVNRVITIRFAD